MLPARTPMDRMFVLVTPVMLEMEATVQVLDAFLLVTIPIRKKSTIIFARLVLPAFFL